MYRFSRFVTSVVLLTSVSVALAVAQPQRNGKIFDQGHAMKVRAESAPAQLDSMSGWLGQWDVRLEVFREDTLFSRSDAVSEVCFMNRGHAFMERLHCTDFDRQGTELNTVVFLTFDPSIGRWNLAEANSFTENIRVFDGKWLKNGLELTTSIRLNGGIFVTEFRRGYRFFGSKKIECLVESSTDGGLTWQKKQKRTYLRRDPDPELFAPASDFGSPAPDLPDEARDFDYIIGQWDAFQEINLPGGNVARFPSDATAVYSMNGHAVLEFGWYDIDQNLPDAATSIVRIYNRAMRRWECMYTTNRFHRILYFGGTKEGERIVLYPFETSIASTPVSYYIFDSPDDEGYTWHAETSRDRGKTFDTTWKIRFTPKELSGKNSD